MTIPVLTDRVATLCLALGARSIKDLPGCWEHTWSHDGSEWRIAANGHREPTSPSWSAGAKIPGFSMLVERDGWPMVLCDPGGGSQVCGGEDAALTAVEAELRKAGA